MLTAAHCVCGDNLGGVTCSRRADLVDPAGKSVFFQHAGSFTLAKIAVDPAYNRYTGASDLAILHLAKAVTNIAPSPLNRSGIRPSASAARSWASAARRRIPRMTASSATAS